MNKLLYSIVIFACLISAFAFAEVPSESPDFTYQIQKNSRIEEHIRSALVIYDQYFIDKELSAVSIPESNLDKKLSIEMMNRVYMGEIGKTSVLVKAGVVPSLPELMDKIVKIDGGFLSHQKQESGLVVAVYVKTSDWKEASKIFEELKIKTADQIRNSKFKFRIFNSAYAQDPNCEPNSIIGDVQNDLEKLYNSLRKEGKSFHKCYENYFKGISSMSGELVVDLGKIGLDVITSPVESGKEFWIGANEMLDGAEEFFNELEKNAKAIYSNYDKLSIEEKKQIACKVAGMAVPAVGAGFISGGYAVPVVGSIVLSKLIVEVVKSKENTKIATKLGSPTKKYKSLTAKEASAVIKANSRKIKDLKLKREAASKNLSKDKNAQPKKK